MPLLRRWLMLLLACAGCQSMVSVAEPLATPVKPVAESEPAAGHYWQEGQKAMRQGQPEKAITLYERSLAADPKMECNHLSLAAAHLEKGDQAGASDHLASYLKVHPENGRMRIHHGELLWRLKRASQARAAFEGAIANGQDDLSTAHLIHCHSRLMQIAEVEENEYSARLNRGVGLYLLARERPELPDLEEEPSSEGLLCRALAELTLARLEQPEEARPCWYLYKVWSSLAQRQPAQRWLREATDRAPFTYLTPAEHRGLQLTLRQ